MRDRDHSRTARSSNKPRSSASGFSLIKRFAKGSVGGATVTETADPGRPTLSIYTTTGSVNNEHSQTASHLMNPNAGAIGDNSNNTNNNGDNRYTKLSNFSSSQSTAHKSGGNYKFSSPLPPTAPNVMYNISEHDLSENELSETSHHHHHLNMDEIIVEVAQWDIMCFCESKMDSISVEEIIDELKNKNKKHGETPQLGATKTPSTSKKAKAAKLQTPSKTPTGKGGDPIVSCFVCNHTLTREVYCYHCENTQQHPTSCFVICYGCLWRQVLCFSILLCYLNFLFFLPFFSVFSCCLQCCSMCLVLDYLFLIDAK